MQILHINLTLNTVFTFFCYFCYTLTDINMIVLLTFSLSRACSDPILFLSKIFYSSLFYYTLIPQHKIF